jgi:uncharacterized protein (DUF952 family)
MADIFHMCDSADLDDQLSKEGVYFPPTYKQDGFVHATEDAESLLAIANHFYKSDKGNWVVIKIDVSKLGCEVIYEAPMPVGNTESHVKVDNNDDIGPKFPHIYGSIKKKSITERYPMIRGENGEFLSIQM